MNTLSLLSAAFIFFLWVWTADNAAVSLNGDPRSTMSGLINGTAHRPFVQRVLVPSLTRVFYQAAPEALTKSFSEKIIQQPKIRKEMQRLGWEEEYFPQYIIALKLSLIFLILFLYAVKSIIRVLYKTDDWIVNVLPMLVLLVLPIFFHSGTRYIYDFPALALFTLGFACMLRQGWKSYYLIFAIGLLNKETMVLLMVPFALLFYKTMSRKRFWIHTAAQLLLFVLLRGWIGLIYGNNPGGNFEFHFFGNVRLLADLWTPERIIALLAIVLLVFYRFREKPVVLRKGLITLIPFAILTLFFGCIGEIRAMYEVYPIVALLVLHTIFFSIFRFEYTTREL